jgi:hypothetical protein
MQFVTEPTIKEKEMDEQNSESLVQKNVQGVQSDMNDDTTNREREGKDDIENNAPKGSGSETSSRVLRPCLSSSSIKTVLEAMRRNPGKPTVQENGCAALGHMASMDDMNKEMIVEAEGIDVIIQGTDLFFSLPHMTVQDHATYVYLLHFDQRCAYTNKRQRFKNMRAGYLELWHPTETMGAESLSLVA